MDKCLTGISAGPSRDTRGSAVRVLEGRCALFEARSPACKKLRLMGNLTQQGVGSQHPRNVEYEEKGCEKDGQHQCCLDESLSSGVTYRAAHASPKSPSLSGYQG